MRRSLFLGLCALLAPLAPLLAGDAYVPLAANTALGAATYRTILIATNTGTTSQSFSVTYAATGSNGSTGQPSSYGLPPGSTLRLYNAVPAGSRGMLELSGAADIVVSARVEAVASNGALLASAQVPVLAAGDARKAGQKAHLQSLEHGAGAVTDFGLMNLSAGAAQCTVQAFRANGGKIGNAVRLAVPARSQRDFSGALATLGETSIKDARFEVSCDQLFGTYAMVYRSGGPETVVLGPAGTLDGDLIPDPVDDGVVTFNLPGQFANGTIYSAFDLPLQSGVHYGRVRIEFDLYVDRWRLTHPLNPNFKTVASLRRSASSRADRILYCGLLLKGSKDYKTILDMGTPPGSHEGETITSGKGPWKERSTYRVVIDYDAEARRVTFEAYQAGKLVQTLSGPLVSSDIFNLPGKNVRVDFSAPGVGSGAFFPTLGWKYSNLAVKLTPRR
jgi:hypothetical protein